MRIADSNPAPALPAHVRLLVQFGVPLALVAANALSFQGLYSLARLVGWPGHLAWLMPVALEVCALVSVAVWLGTPIQLTEARQRARTGAIAALALSVTGNGLFHLIEYGIINVTWPIILGVTVIPPVIAAMLVHLAISINHPAAPASETALEQPEADPIPNVGDAALKPVPLPATSRATGTSRTTRIAAVNELLHTHGDALTGKIIAAELGVSASYGCSLLRDARAALNPQPQLES